MPSKAGLETLRLLASRGGRADYYSCDARTLIPLERDGLVEMTREQVTRNGRQRYVDYIALTDAGRQAVEGANDDTA